jgi:hypothetical protein
VYEQLNHFHSIPKDCISMVHLLCDKTLSFVPSPSILVMKYPRAKHHFNWIGSHFGLNPKIRARVWSDQSYLWFDPNWIEPSMTLITLGN